MTNEYKADITLNEKDSLQDLLNLEKEVVKTYFTAMTEGASKGFRTLVKAHWNESAETQMDVFLLMTELGYAKVESAPEDTLSQEKNKFCKVKSQLA